MLLIRQPQLESLVRADRESFERWVQLHARRFFPRQTNSLSDAELQELIRSAVSAAEYRGLTSRVDLCKFVDLTVLLGPSFESRPEMQWARDVLESDLEAALRIAELQEAAISYLAKRKHATL